MEPRTPSNLSRLIGISLMAGAGAVIGYQLAGQPGAALGGGAFGALASLLLALTEPPHEGGP